MPGNFHLRSQLLGYVALLRGGELPFATADKALKSKGVLSYRHVR